MHPPHKDPECDCDPCTDCSNCPGLKSAPQEDQRACSAPCTPAPWLTEVEIIAPRVPANVVNYVYVNNRRRHFKIAESSCNYCACLCNVISNTGTLRLFDKEDSTHCCLKDKRRCGCRHCEFCLLCYGDLNTVTDWNKFQKSVSHPRLVDSWNQVTEEIIKKDYPSSK